MIPRRSLIFVSLNHPHLTVKIWLLVTRDHWYWILEWYFILKFHLLQAMEEHAKHYRPQELINHFSELTWSIFLVGCQLTFLTHQKIRRLFHNSLSFNHQNAFYLWLLLRMHKSETFSQNYRLSRWPTGHNFQL